MKYAKIAVGAPFYPYDTAFDYAVPEEWQKVISIGSLVGINFRNKKTWGVVTSLSENTEVPLDKIKNIDEVKFTQAVFDEKRLNFLNWISQYYYHSLGLVFESALPGPVRKGTERTLKNDDSTAIPLSIHDDKFKTLNEAQSQALEEIKNSPLPGHLLWGITGSGKTEVYLHLIREYLKKEKEVLILVPEISLTPQLLSRFEEKFPGQIAVFHSAQKPTQLRKNWLDVFHGRKKIALGARSALFAPLFNLGLIIVDEEHEASYKQDERLRYHARDCAHHLAKLYQAKIVLGSATPSLETYQLVKEEKIALSVMKTRAVAEALLPEIEFIDLKKNIGEKNLDPGANLPIEEKEFEWSGPEGKKSFYFSTELLQELSLLKEKNKQAILFLNRRGLGRQVLCMECGHIPECPSCHVSLKPHKKGLLCHYCSYLETDLKTCRHCGAVALEDVGLGTESVEDELKIHFPELRVLRLDRDTSEKTGEMEKILDQFKNREADVLIGTQMVAKGHDFPQVTLVGIVLADTGFSIPDFRSSERNIQLLTQVAGRAGRDKDPGKVLIQSFQVEQDIFQYLKFNSGLESYQEFMSHELQERHLLNYPPFCQLIALKLDSNQENLVEEAAQHIGNALSRIKGDFFEILGPVPSPLSKIKNRYRWQLLIKSSNTTQTHKALDWILKVWHEKKLEQKFRTRLMIDIDPINML